MRGSDSHTSVFTVFLDCIILPCASLISGCSAQQHVAEAYSPGTTGYITERRCAAGSMISDVKYTLWCLHNTA